MQTGRQRWTGMKESIISIVDKPMASGYDAIELVPTRFARQAPINDRVWCAAS